MFLKDVIQSTILYITTRFYRTRPTNRVTWRTADLPLMVCSLKLPGGRWAFLVPAHMCVGLRFDHTDPGGGNWARGELCHPAIGWRLPVRCIIAPSPTWDRMLSGGNMTEWTHTHTHTQHTHICIHTHTHTHTHRNTNTRRNAYTETYAARAHTRARINTHTHTCTHTHTHTYKVTKV